MNKISQFNQKLLNRELAAANENEQAQAYRRVMLFAIYAQRIALWVGVISVVIGWKTGQWGWLMVIFLGWVIHGRNLFLQLNNLSDELDLFAKNQKMTDQDIPVLLEIAKKRSLWRAGAVGALSVVGLAMTDMPWWMNLFFSGLLCLAFFIALYRSGRLAVERAAKGLESD